MTRSVRIAFFRCFPSLFKSSRDLTYRYNLSSYSTLNGKKSIPLSACQMLLLYKNNSITVVHQSCTIRLLCNTANLNREGYVLQVPWKNS